MHQGSAPHPLLRGASLAQQVGRSEGEMLQGKLALPLLYLLHR